MTRDHNECLIDAFHDGGFQSLWTKEMHCIILVSVSAAGGGYYILSTYCTSRLRYLLFSLIKLSARCTEELCVVHDNIYTLLL